MPWKGEKDPYRIWLSEVILQQTRVEQGQNYYLRFIQKYPTIRALAAANDTDVFKIWEGLGYYSRCRNMLETARYIYKEKNAVFPNSFKEIIALKGIGPYTAAAISSFAFNLPHPVIDGNVIRVISRFFGVDDLVDSSLGKEKISSLAEKLINRKDPGVYNQAIMDFGATVCTPRNPRCSQCPLSKNCIAFTHNRVEELPRKGKKQPPRKRYFHYLVVIKDNKVYIREREAGDIWRHLHEFLLLETDKMYPAKSVFTKCQELLPPNFSEAVVLYSSEEFKQQLSHQQIHARFIILTSVKEFNLPGFISVPIKSLPRFAFPGIINKWLSTRPFNQIS